MGVGAGLCKYDVVVKRSRSLSHLLMSFLYNLAFVLDFIVILPVLLTVRRMTLEGTQSVASV